MVRILRALFLYSTFLLTAHLYTMEEFRHQPHTPEADQKNQRMCQKLQDYFRPYLSELRLNGIQFENRGIALWVKHDYQDIHSLHYQSLLLDFLIISKAHLTAQLVSNNNILIRGTIDDIEIPIAISYNVADLEVIHSCNILLVGLKIMLRITLEKIEQSDPTLLVNYLLRLLTLNKNNLSYITELATIAQQLHPQNHAPLMALLTNETAIYYTHLLQPLTTHRTLPCASKTLKTAFKNLLKNIWMYRRISTKEYLFVPALPKEILNLIVQFLAYNVIIKHGSG